MTVDVIVNKGSIVEVSIDRSYKVTGASSADEVSYDNTVSGLAADNVQDAIDEVAGSGDMTKAVYDPNLIEDDAFDLRVNVKHQTTAATEIYVTTTGNDTTGDGSLGNPYLTIFRALQDIGQFGIILNTVNINISSGTFTWGADEQQIMSSIQIFTGSLNFIGELNTEKTGLTLTPDGSNPFLYDVTGGTMTTSAHKGHLILEGSDYFPIQNNTTNQLTAQDRLGASVSIYSIGTTIQVDNEFSLCLDTFAYQQASLLFKNINFNGDISIRNSSSFISMYACNVNGDIGVSSNGKLDFESGSVFGKINSSSVRLFLFHFNIDAGGTTNYPLQTSFGVTVLRGGLLSNPSSNYCIFAKDSEIYNNNGTAGKDRGICFINATTAIYADSASFDSKSANTVQFDTITNVVDSDDYKNISISIPTVSGTISGNIRADASEEYINITDATYIETGFEGSDTKVDNEIKIEKRSKAGSIGITYGLTVSVDFAEGDFHQISQVTGNMTINGSNIENGQTGVITFTIDATGGYTIASGTGTWQKYDDSAYDFTDCNVANTKYRVFYAILESNIIEYSIQAIT